MRRRDFIALLGATAAFPSPGLAQPSGARRLGVLTIPARDDPLYKPRAAALVDGLAALGWKVGDNLSIEWRHSGGDASRLQRFADELVALAPDALLAIGSPSIEALRRRTRSIPIVFTIVSDPVGQGFVESLARPGGNVTGFTDFDVSMAAKWLGIMTEVAPVSTIGVLYNPGTTPLAESMLQVVAAAAPAHGATARPAVAGDEVGIEAAATALAQQVKPGMIVLPDASTVVHRTVILRAAERLRLPVVYWNKLFVLEGGLVSYGVDTNDLHRRPADYIDRIFKSADPGMLPVQNPTRFELFANLKTARALGIEFPPALLAAADEVIE